MTSLCISYEEMFTLTLASCTWHMSNTVTIASIPPQRNMPDKKVTLIE